MMVATRTVDTRSQPWCQIRPKMNFAMQTSQSCSYWQGHLTGTPSSCNHCKSLRAASKDASGAGRAHRAALASTIPPGILPLLPGSMELALALCKSDRGAVLPLRESLEIFRPHRWSISSSSSGSEATASELALLCTLTCLQATLPLLLLLAGVAWGGPSDRGAATAIPGNDVAAWRRSRFAPRCSAGCRQRGGHAGRSS